VLEKASYTYKNTVIQKTGQPTHLAVICSVPLIPMARIIKRKPLRHNLLFHGVLCLERSERNGYKNEEKRNEEKRSEERSVERKEKMIRNA